jgi:predicted amidohydrolase
MEDEQLPSWLQEWLDSDRTPISYHDLERPHHVVVSLIQGRPMQSVTECLRICEAVYARYTSDIIVFAENSLVPPVRGGKTNHLDPLIAFTLAHPVTLVLGSCDEMDGPQRYVTCFCVEDGRICCRYRKRHATRTGAHAEGKEVGQWNCSRVNGALCGVLICFDAENADVRDEALAHKPHIMFNPTWIPSPSTAFARNGDLVAPGWRTAIDSMRLKFQRMW